MSGIRAKQVQVTQKTLRIQDAAERVASHLAAAVLMAARSGAQQGTQLHVPVPTGLYLSEGDYQGCRVKGPGVMDLGETMRKAVKELRKQLAEAGASVTATTRFKFLQNQAAVFNIYLTAAT